VVENPGILLVNSIGVRPLPKSSLKLRLPEAGRGFQTPPSLAGKGAGGLGFPKRANNIPWFLGMGNGEWEILTH